MDTTVEFNLIGEMLVGDNKEVLLEEQELAIKLISIINGYRVNHQDWDENESNNAYWVIASKEDYNLCADEDNVFVSFEEDNEVVEIFLSDDMVEAIYQWLRVDNFKEYSELDD